MKKSLVDNCADEDQVKAAGFKEKFGRDQEINDLRTLLSTVQGRRFFWRLLGYCRVHQSIWEPSARIHYNSGMQDVGHFITGEIVLAGEEFYFKMMTEAKGES